MATLNYTLVILGQISILRSHSHLVDTSVYQRFISGYILVALGQIGILRSHSHLVDTSADSDIIHQLIPTASLIPRLLVGG